MLVAFALRTYRLDLQSLWADEGTSVALAPRSLARIVQDASHDIHPPLYYVSLHFWVALAGTSVVAVRTLSGLYGTLLVTLTGLLGWRWFGRAAGLVAAGAAALSPFAIHYSQETRMYILVALLGAASWYAFQRALGGERRWWAAYWPLTLALLYTHYYAVALVVAQNLAWLRLRIRPAAAGRKKVARHGIGPLRWVLLQGSLLLLYLPWLWYSRATILNWPAISAPVTLPFITRETLRIFSLGPATLPAWSPWLMGFVLLGLAGLALPAPCTARAPAPRLLAALYFLVPPGLMVILSALDRPFYNPKFLLLALPGYHLLLGHGAAALGHRVSAPRAALVPLGALAFLALAAAPPLHNEFNDPRFWRDDYRGLARTIEATAGPHDAILLNGPGQIEIFDYYFHGPQPRYPLPRTRPLDPKAVRAELAAIAARTERLYAVLWAEREGDPEGLIEGWLDQHAFKAGDRWFGNIRLAVYQFGDTPEPRPVGARFGERIELEAAAANPPSVISGDIIALTLRWRVIAAPVVRYQLFAQLLDAGDHIVGQRDIAPDAVPTDAWQAGEVHASRLGLAVRPGTPPGDYRLVIGLYDSASGTRLPLTDGTDALPLGTIHVRAPAVPPTTGALDLTRPQAAQLGQVRLVGSSAHKLGADQAPETPLRPGEPLAVVLFWQAEQTAPGVPALTLHLEGPRQAEWPWQPVEGRYPPAAWSAGEVVRDPQTFFLPADLPPGRYRLRLLAPARRPVDLGTVTVAAP
ncbi:MAG: glycosyltransferase family 39 protein [Ardenticatenaceae bacterium]|nr:glycosyltransferase family 39 protein [Ardenticatenaceae bacterium]